MKWADYTLAQLKTVAVKYKKHMAIGAVSKMKKEDLIKVLDKHLILAEDGKKISIKANPEKKFLGFPKAPKPVEAVKVEKPKAMRAEEVKVEMPKPVKAEKVSVKAVKATVVEKPKEEDEEEKLKKQVSRIAMVGGMGELVKTLTKIGIRGKLQSNPILRAQQILQNFDTIPLMKKFIKAYEERDVKVSEKDVEDLKSEFLKVVKGLTWAKARKIISALDFKGGLPREKDKMDAMIIRSITNPSRIKDFLDEAKKV